MKKIVSIALPVAAGVIAVGVAGIMIWRYCGDAVAEAVNKQPEPEATTEIE